MSYLNSTLLPQQGAHPVSTNTIHLVGPSQSYDSCTLHLHYTLPPLLFVDTHELAQRDTSYSFQHWGTRDIERPVHSLPDEVSELLLNVQIPHALGRSADDDVNETVIQVEVPMHLRYGEPKAEHAETWQGKLYTRLLVDWPQAFVRCPSSIKSDPVPPSATLPEHILYALPHKEEANFLISIPPHSSSPALPQHTLVVPLGNSQDLSIVEPLTALTILACFLWLFRVAWRVATRLNGGAKRLKTG